jgi:hypothetical protein
MGMRYYDKEAGIDTTIIYSFPKIVKEFKKIGFKVGHTLEQLIKNKDKSAIYNRIIFYTIELMLLDVAAGDIVYLDKKKNSRFYVVFRAASPGMIKGNGYSKKSKIPKLDFEKSNYKVPFFAFDPGYPDAHPAIMYAPNYIYSVLIENVNAGVKYPKPASKKFWFED